MRAWLRYAYALVNQESPVTPRVRAAVIVQAATAAAVIVAPVALACAPAPVEHVHESRTAPVAHQSVVPGTKLTPAPARPVLRPCAEEDSAGPCYWNAATRGNGRGRSFLVTKSGAVVYVSVAYVRELDRVNGGDR